ncbi:hypothetical protein [Prosthecobacter sp.]|uniref:hypothetical protein n=1 Tax=Prosthecobacter sp. TaxID=1965333 RepID=UPI002ABB27CC|nr:hypothetical protein [Prosthecobacter sp.]MDZ4405867.1 hypothetical protein [Prosthecobacter sp.]
MKKPVLLLLLTACGLRAEPLSVQITNVSGEPTAAFLIAAEKDGIIISTAPNGGSSYKLPLANIRDMSIDEPKGWSTALQTYAAGNFAEAEKQFALLGEELAKIVPLQDGYGSLARLYQFRSLQKLGRHADLAKVMDKQLANPLNFGPHYMEDFVDLEGWTWLGKEDWQTLGVFIRKFEDANPLKLPQAPFKRLRSSRLAGLCYLRAVWNERGQKQPDLALMDYHRALTLDLGSDTTLLRRSAVAALLITEAKLAAAPKDDKLTKQAKSLALVCRDLGGPGALPKEFEKYLK